MHETDSIQCYTGEGLEELIEKLHNLATDGYNPDSDLIVTNARHYQALLQAQAPLRQALAGIDNGISADFIAQDIRETLHHLGTITGAVTTDTPSSTPSSPTWVLLESANDRQS